MSKCPTFEIRIGANCALRVVRPLAGTAPQRSPRRAARSASRAVRCPPLALRLVLEALGREVTQTLDRLTDHSCLLARSLARVLLGAPLREPALAVQLRHRGLPLTAGCHRSRSL